MGSDPKKIVDIGLKEVVCSDLKKIVDIDPKVVDIGLKKIVCSDSKKIVDIGRKGAVGNMGW